MPIVRISGAVVVLASISALPVQAQQAMSEPAYCAFFYPNANCMNKGPGNPYTDPNYRRNGGMSSGQWPNAAAKPDTETNAQGQRIRPHVNRQRKVGSERKKSAPVP